jgi:hypothetical protein
VIGQTISHYEIMETLKLVVQIADALETAHGEALPPGNSGTCRIRTFLRWLTQKGSKEFQ